MECPNCGGDLVERVGYKGRLFLRCKDYPNCTYGRKLDTDPFDEPFSERENFIDY